MLSLCSAKCDGVGDFVKGSIFSLGNKKEDEENGDCQDDTEDEVGVLVQTVLKHKERK